MMEVTEIDKCSSLLQLWQTFMPSFLSQNTFSMSNLPEWSLDYDGTD
jgi:hypothetical protein